MRRATSRARVRTTDEKEEGQPVDSELLECRYRQGNMPGEVASEAK